MGASLADRTLPRMGDDDLRTHRIETNGIHLHVVESGPVDGPAVLCCHGFPESWYSWRHQLRVLGEAGYRVLAPDMRGYGRSAKPADPLAYTQLHHTGDLVGVLDALGIDQAVIVGHDWGGPAAWTAAQLRPDRFRAIAALGVPFLGGGDVAPTVGMRAAFGDTWFYFLHFQEPGRAEAELDANVETFLRGFFHSLSGDSPRHPFEVLGGGPRPSTVIEHLAQPTSVASWMTADDLEPVLAMSPGALEAMPGAVPNLRPPVMLPGCGHWTQQERPDEVNAALLDFLS